MTRFAPAVLPLAVSLFLGASASAQMLTQAMQVENELELSAVKPFEEVVYPFRRISNHEGRAVDLGFPPIRPLDFSADGGTLYAVNNHDSVLQVYADATGLPTSTIRVPWNPVSVQRYALSDADGELLLVACRGSMVLCVVDPTAGILVDLMHAQDEDGNALAEPGDVIIDHDTLQAYVSCSANDKVIEIDLATFTVTRSFTIGAKTPTWLSFDLDGNVLVAPLHSGNNSVPHRDPDNHLNQQAQELSILDLDDPNVAVTGLDDHDLYRIVRANGVVQPVLRGMGTSLFTHGVNPATGELWMVNTEANNKNPKRQFEPLIQGEVIFNQLSMASLPPLDSPPVAPTRIYNLDDFDADPLSDPGADEPVTFDALRSIGQPVAMAFGPFGFTFIAGLLTDNLTIRTPTGAWYQEIDLDDGSIPRFLYWHEGLSSVFVYCWGTNLVEGYFVSATVDSDPWITLDLGHDPIPAERQAGRALFFSAHLSEHNNASCASCHIDNRTDMAVWAIGKEWDDKGPMVTQPLENLTLVDTFHWRGEQRNGLDDFNGAFVNLLGATQEMLEPDFSNFKEYVLGITSPANPFQNKERLLDSRIRPPLDAETYSTDPQAPAGQELFMQRCEGCHALPAGSSNDFVNDGSIAFEEIDRRTWFKTFPLVNGNWRKMQDADISTPEVDMKEVDFNDAFGIGDTGMYAPNGAGFTHAGLLNNLSHFMKVFNMPKEAEAHVVAYMHQFDNAIAPAVHRAVLLDANSTDEDRAEIREYLIPQANEIVPTLEEQPFYNCDLVVIGKSSVDGKPESMAWYWDRSIGAFVGEDSSLAPRGMRFFEAQAATGLGSNVFMGVPVGMGKRFSIDYDGDELTNFDEALAGTEIYNPDTDGDGFPDGYEVLHGSDPDSDLSTPSDGTAPQVEGDHVEPYWITNRTALFGFATNEKTRWVLDLVGPDGNRQLSSDEYAFEHKVLVRELIPCTPANCPSDQYTATLTVYDHSQNPAAAPTVFTFKAKPRPGDGNNVFASVALDKLSWNQPTLIGINQGTGLATVTASASARVVRRDTYEQSDPVEDYVIVARVLVDDITGWPITTSTAQSFQIPRDGQFVVFDAQEGPFLMALPTDSSGQADLDFTISGVPPGSTVRMVIENVLPVPLPALYDPQDPIFLGFDRWDVPTTPAELRGLEISL